MTEIELEHGINSGVMLRASASGIVPIYEEHEARLERGIDINTWMEMPTTEKALIIAARRIRIAIYNLQQEAEILHANREAAKHGKK